MTDIVVLRNKTHRVSTAEFAATLQSRLPELDVALAETAAQERELLSHITVGTGYVSPLSRSKRAIRSPRSSVRSLAPDIYRLMFLKTMM